MHFFQRRVIGKCLITDYMYHRSKSDGLQCRTFLELAANSWPRILSRYTQGHRAPYRIPWSSVDCGRLQLFTSAEYS